jgi:hypothetical protein
MQIRQLVEAVANRDGLLGFGTDIAVTVAVADFSLIGPFDLPDLWDEWDTRQALDACVGFDEVKRWIVMVQNGSKRRNKKFDLIRLD